MFIKELLEVSIEGMGKYHRTSIFPCGIFQLMKGVNREPGDPNYDLFRLALKSTSLRLYPNYANCSFSVDKLGLESDRKFKENLINNLTPEDYNKLIIALEKNPEIAKKMSLEVVDE